jgi:sugar fermentation stimulation protein A
MQSKIITAIFIRELRNRFLCEVSIAGETVVCYVPSSCHLSNFLKLEGKQVLLIPTLSKNSRTQYALFAVSFKRSYILLNMSIANRAIENSIKGRRFSYLGKRRNVLKEYTIAGYKCDLYIADTNTIIEIKSLISYENIAVFPTVYSERTVTQMKALYELLLDGKKVCLCIVSLNPYVKEVQIDSSTVFFNDLIRCVEIGLQLKAYTSWHNDGIVSIKSEIPVNFTNN